MHSLGASKVEVQTLALKFSFPSGRIEITQLDPIPDLPPEIAVVGGREVAVGMIDSAQSPLPGAALRSCRAECRRINGTMAYIPGLIRSVT